MDRLERLRLLYRRWAASPLARALRTLLVVAALAIMGWSLLIGVRDLQARAAPVDVRLAGIGFAGVLLASLLGSAVWFALLCAFRLRTPWRQSIVIHMTSNVAKYIPGYGWHYVSKGYFLQETARPEAVFLVIFSELVVVLSSGAVLGLAAAAHYALPILGYTLAPWAAWLLILTLLGAAAGWLSFVYRRLAAGGGAHPWRDRAQTSFWAAAAWLLGGIGWLAFAAGLHLFVLALDSALAITYPLSVLALTFSSIVSILVIFVPAGLGVREVTMAALLAPAVPPALGVTISILLRLAVIVSELLQLGLVLFWAQHWPQNLKNTIFLEKQRGNTPNGLL